MQVKTLQVFLQSNMCCRNTSSYIKTKFVCDFIYCFEKQKYTFLVFGGFLSGKDKVILNDVKVLTLRADHMTTGRRSSPVPQVSVKPGSYFLANSNAIQILTSQIRNKQCASVDQCLTPAKHSLRIQPCDVKICISFTFKSELNWA